MYKFLVFLTIFLPWGNFFLYPENVDFDKALTSFVIIVCFWWIVFFVGSRSYQGENTPSFDDRFDGGFWRVLLVCFLIGIVLKSLGVFESRYDCPNHEDHCGPYSGMDRFDARP